MTAVGLVENCKNHHTLRGRESHEALAGSEDVFGFLELLDDLFDVHTVSPRWI